jgi:hypothetical protein
MQVLRHIQRYAHVNVVLQKCLARKISVNLTKIALIVKAVIFVTKNVLQEVKMTNYEVYFGDMDRALDSLTLLQDYGKEQRFGEHPRRGVREWQKEIAETRLEHWLPMECTNQRWWAGIPLKR